MEGRAGDAEEPGRLPPVAARVPEHEVDVPALDVVEGVGRHRPARGEGLPERGEVERREREVEEEPFKIGCGKRLSGRLGGLDHQRYPARCTEGVGQYPAALGIGHEEEGVGHAGKVWRGEGRGERGASGER